MPTGAEAQPIAADWTRDAIRAGQAGVWRWDHRECTLQLCSGAAHLLLGDAAFARKDMAFDDVFSQVQPGDVERLRALLGVSFPPSLSRLGQCHIVSKLDGGQQLLLRGRTEWGASGEPLTTIGIVVNTPAAPPIEDDWLSPVVDNALDEAAHHGVAAYNIIQGTGLAALIEPARALLMAIGREMATGMKGRRPH